MENEISDRMSEVKKPAYQRRQKIQKKERYRRKKET